MSIGIILFILIIKDILHKIKLRKEFAMNIRTKNLIKNITLPLIVGGVSSLLTKKSMESFQSLNQPPPSPPKWLFPVVWTALYIAMGVAAHLVDMYGGKYEETKRAKLFYYLQLGFNFFWTLIFFNLGAYVFALIWIISMWILILTTAIKFRSIKPLAGYLFIPYLLWVAFATYLNAGIAVLNR